MDTHSKEFIHKHRTHRILAHSYFVYFFLFLFGVVLDIVFSVKFFSGEFMVSLGVLLLILASLLIFWAQKTSHNLLKEDITTEIFYRGPYCYTRNPTHFGLFLLILGFGFIANATFVVLFTLLSFLVTRFIFLNKHEKFLEEKHGDIYLKYKKLVKF